jgi:hypothetical protein
MRATVEQLQSYKSRYPVPKFELPENIYTDDFDVTEAEKVPIICLFCCVRDRSHPLTCHGI